MTPSLRVQKLGREAILLHSTSPHHTIITMLPNRGGFDFDFAKRYVAIYMGCGVWMGINYLKKRNALLEKQGKKMPTAKKTGTTIVGVVFKVCSTRLHSMHVGVTCLVCTIIDVVHCIKGGVCLGADTRATEGPIVADKNCEKIHYIAPNIYCCGAGTSADTENTTGTFDSIVKLI
jgi:hypothetical protein